MSEALVISAFVAGILMFLAPCTLPIIPGYLLFISGAPKVGTQTTKQKRIKTVLASVAFVCGFSCVFIFFGLFAGTLGSFIGPHRELISRLSGVMLILFGLVMLGTARIPYLSGEWHAKIPAFLSIGTVWSSFSIGALFALGWSPCIGPILGTVLLVATTSGTQGQGALLLAVFSLGLGIPFILTALLIDSATQVFTAIGKGARYISIVSALILMCLGILIVSGQLGIVTDWFYRLFELFGYTSLYHYL